MPLAGQTIAADDFSLPAEASAYGNGLNGITSATFATLPSFPAAVALTNPSSVRDLLVDVTVSAWMTTTAAANDVRLGVAFSGGLTIASGSPGSGAAVGWGEVAICTESASNQHQVRQRITIPAGASAVTVTAQALRTGGAGTQGCNYAIVRIKPVRFL